MNPVQFNPPWWLTNPHLQSMWGVLCRHTMLPDMQRERIELSDGDFIDIDSSADSDQAIVLIMHGLGGSIESHYASGLINTLVKHGYQAVFMHFRGCSGEPNRLARFYNAGDTVDINYIVQLIKQRKPHVPLFVIGYSLSGNALLKWLGEENTQHLLTAAVAISVPFDLAKATNRMNQGFSRVYQQRLLVGLKRLVLAKLTLLQPTVSKQAVQRLKTIKAFDDYITAPLHGYQNADDYYRRCSSRQFLAGITTPTLILHAKDDPFVPEDAIPTTTELSSSVYLQLTDKGGHVGFVGYNNGLVYWSELQIVEFIATNLELVRTSAL